MKMTNELAELAGIMCGDGCPSSCNGAYVIYISGHKIDDREYHEVTIKNLFLHSIGIPSGKKYSHLKIPTIIKENQYFAL